MKKVISLLLAAALLLSLCACGKTATLADLSEFPIGGTIAECEKFVKSCGYEVQNSNDRYVSFTDGTWEGMATPTGLTLDLANTFSMSDADFDTAVENLRKDVVALCGEPYASHSGNQMTPFSNEFYACGDKVITISVMSGMVKSLSLHILAAATE